MRPVWTQSYGLKFLVCPSSGKDIANDKSGFVFEDRLYPTNQGTPQEGIISPTLANLTLDGMEKLIKDSYWTNAKGTVNVKIISIKVIGLNIPMTLLLLLQI